MTQTHHPHRPRLVIDNDPASPSAVPPAAAIPARAARPIPEDFGLTAADLRVWYAPGRAGVALALLIAAGYALMEAIGVAQRSEPWILGALSGLLSGVLTGGLAGLGAMVLVHWADPLIGRLWPVYGRLRRYRDAVAEARRAEDEDKDEDKEGRNG